MKKHFHSFKQSLAALFFTASAAQVYAQSTTLASKMTGPLNSILNFFTSAAVKTILVIMVAAAALVFAFNKDNEKMKRNAVAIGIAGIILLSASAVVDLFWVT
jgi:type IV secretory pathway VirB2 component (pilin)